LALVARAAGPLSRLIANITDQALVSLRLPLGEREPIFDDACRLLGFLGEQVPAVFRDPNAPEILFEIEDEPMPTDPLDALGHALYRLQQGAFPQGKCLADPLIFIEAAERYAQAISDRSVKVFHDSRLELSLVRAAAPIGDLGVDCAKERDGFNSYRCVVALSRLAEKAEQPFYNEYAVDLAADFVGIGVLAEEHSLPVRGLGEDLATFVAHQLVDHLNAELDSAMHEAAVAGRYCYADDKARWAFVKRVAKLAGRNFGFNLDAV
jgi:hypothetical protein